jgi:thiamine-phosphate pyrophosphorylase
MLARRSCQTEAVSDRASRLAQARLYLVCGAAPDRLLEQALRGGVDVVQLRCKEGSVAAIEAAAARFARLCAAHGALFILNDRPDLAVRVGADGVHVGQDDMPVPEARELVGSDRIVGLSTHSPEQVEAAAGLAVDYIGVGPVHATPTKPGRPAVGFELVRYAAARAATPFFAIGGITPGNVGAVVEAGARRVAVVRAITDAGDPENAARALRSALEVPEQAGVGAQS